MQQPRTRYALSGDVHIAWQVLGAGTHDVVLVPGYISNLDLMWQEPGFSHLLWRLGSFARVLCFDKRGTGLSDPVSKLPTLETRMDDVRAVMDAAGVQRAVVLGASEGAPMSILFATTYPERTSALVLYGAYARFHEAVLPPEQLEAFIAGIEADWGSGASLRHFAPGRLEDAAFAAWWARFERLGASPHAAVALARMNAAIDVQAALPLVRVPTLVLHRRDDVRVKVAAGRELARLIPNARYVELPGSDHPIWTGDTDRVVDEIEEFVTGSRAAEPPDRVLGTVLALSLADTDQVAALQGDQAWCARLEQWHQAVAEVAARHRARPLGPPQPDGAWFLLFDGPARAVRCAAALRDLAPGLLGCGLRCGLHTGEMPVAAAGSAAGGLALQVAAHIGRLAHAGEVLVSGTLRDLVAGAGLRFRDREQRLTLPPEAGGGRLALLALAGDGRPVAEAPPVASTLPGLSRREQEILRLVAQGLSNPAIAAGLTLSEHTVKRHVTNILVKLGQPSRAAAAALAARSGML